MNIGEMRRLLSQHNLQLTRSLGQNFLHDANQVRRIVAAAELESGDRVLEVGPGLGPLTELLVEGAGRVLAVEKDARLVAVLRDRFPSDDRIELLEADALDWLRAESRDWSDWKCVSNLPYSVGSPILVELALNPRPPRRMVVTLQDEVIDRIAAKPDTEEYGVLTLLVGLRFRVASVFPIPRGCFFPAPDVESACAVLERRLDTGLDERHVGTFVRMVKAGFQQRRKMLPKLLAAEWPREAVMAAMERAGVPVTARAETVSREQFLAMASVLASSGC